MTHELGPLVTDVHEAFAVYKDYDGNAPDTDALVVCATEDLAREVADWCGENEAKFGHPIVDGSEWCAHYDTRDTIARAPHIARTLSEALTQLGYEPKEYSQLNELLRLMREEGFDPETYELTEETADEIPTVVMGDLWADATEQKIAVYRGGEQILTTADPAEVVRLFREEQDRLAE